jgi:hypothetical protein
MKSLKLRVLDPSFAVCRLDRADASLAKDLGGPFSSLSVTEDEVSLVCVESAAPPEADVEGGWRCLKVEGPLNFSEVGILSSLTTTLAEAGVSLFAVSTWDTDYLMVKEESLETAMGVLEGAGHELEKPS